MKYKSKIFILLLIFNILFVGCENTNNVKINSTDKIELKSYEEQMVKEINKVRKENNLQELSLDDDAEKLATYKVNDMIDNHYFSHENLEGKHIYDVAEDMGIKAKVVGENLHSGELQTDVTKYNKQQLIELINKNYGYEDIMKAFMDSPTHKDNILKAKYTNVYVSVVFNKNTIYVVQIFLQK